MACCLWWGASACEDKAPVGPGAVETTMLVVGPAPLRRLSNQEYLNALADLFPGQTLSLPALPADSEVAGFENAAEAQRPSDLRIARIEAIANLVAEAATADENAVRTLIGCDWSTPDAAAPCASQAVDRLGLRLFRRPLEAPERERLLTRFSRWSSDVGFPSAVRMSLSAMLQSPQFIYRPEPETAIGAGASTIVPVEPYAMASRLSFFLWESVPDDALLDAAGRDELRIPEQIRAQAERMLDDPRARRVYWSFHRQWLGLDRVLDDEHSARTPEVDAAWSVARQRAAHDETRLFVEHVAFENGSLSDLLTSPRAFIDSEMAAVYGLPAPAIAWSEARLPETERAGLFTRAAFLAGTSHRGGTSPPVRGNALLLRALCKLPAPPPPNVNVAPPMLDPSAGPQTNRMAFEARTRSPECQSCHATLNGIGFGFESYTASGAFATQDHGLPVDAHGALHGTDVDGPFEGAIELSRMLARSDQLYHCAAQQWIRYALGRAPIRGEEPWVDGLALRFAASGGNLRALLLDIVTAPSFRLQRLDPEEP